MVLSCIVLYVGAMWVIPSDGNSMTSANVWHGILSFGGMLIIFLSYCLYTAFIFHMKTPLPCGAVAPMDVVLCCDL